MTSTTKQLGIEEVGPLRRDYLGRRNLSILWSVTAVAVIITVALKVLPELRRKSG